MANSKEYDEMPDEVDFSQSVPNPYVGNTRRRVTLNLDGGAVDYFKAESARTGVPYQTIINMYLCQCAREQRHLAFV